MWGGVGGVGFDIKKMNRSAAFFRGSGNPGLVFLLSPAGWGYACGSPCPATDAFTHLLNLSGVCVTTLNSAPKGV